MGELIVEGDGAESGLQLPPVSVECGRHIQQIVQTTPAGLSKPEKLLMIARKILVELEETGDAAHPCDASVALQLLEWAADSLSPEEDPASYLELQGELAQQYFAFKHYGRAFNRLLLLEDNSELNDLPSWFYRYKAILVYKLDPVEGAARARLVFDLLQESVNTANGTERHRAHSLAAAVAREFVEEVGVALLGRGANSAAVQEFLETSLQAAEEGGFDIEESLLNVRDKLVQMTSAISPSDTKWGEGGPKSTYARPELATTDALIAKALEPIQLSVETIIARMSQIEERLASHETAMSELRLLVSGLPADSGGASYNEVRVLVLGASAVRADQMYGIAASLGMRKENLQIVSDYEAAKRFDIRTLQYSARYDGILVGPLAHKVVGLGDNDSVIAALRGEGFPPFRPIRSRSGQLKITKSAFREALKELLDSVVGAKLR